MPYQPNTFQYISCYGLSSCCFHFVRYRCIFQYISCYGLSFSCSFRYQENFYFNTSHVTVYHQQWIFPVSRLAISIHLMLRFIIVQPSSPSIELVFQYISCYGLSAYSRCTFQYRMQFQYISCYGLSKTIGKKTGQGIVFQYISCYGLSISPFDKVFDVTTFQYISCYGLSGYWHTKIVN